MNHFLEGERVTLRVFDPERDHTYYHAWMKDNHFMRLLDSDPIVFWPKKMMKEWFEKRMDDSITMVIYRKDEETKPVGFIELDGINRVSGDSWVAIGIGDRDDWGKGYGTDAMRLMLNYAFCQLNLHRVSLSVFDYNPRAIRSYEKAGFVREGISPEYLEREGKRYDLVYMGILRSEWMDQCPDSPVTD